MRRSIIFASALCLALQSCEKIEEYNLSTQWHSYTRNVDTKDPEYPIDVLSDGYKMLDIYEADAYKIGDIQYLPKKVVDWGWRFRVRNKSQKSLKVSVEYVLEDADSFEITSSSQDSKYFAPGEVVEIKATSTLDFHKAKRVANSSWRISYQYAW